MSVGNESATKPAKLDANKATTNNDINANNQPANMNNQPIQQVSANNA